MAALTSIVPTLAGATSAGAAVSASDTITQAQLGSKGVHLEILNGGGSVDTVTISDAGTTQGGNALAAGAYTPSTVANGTNRTYYISPMQVNPTTGLVTVTHSFTTSVTYKLFQLG